MRESLRLAPGDATAHGNLARALEMTGDHTGALAEMRRAVELASANKVLQAQLERMSAPAQQTGANQEPTIRVDVREVMVPAIVFDKSGHTIGSAVNAHVRSDVRRGGAVLIPKGTPVRGVLREYTKVNDGTSFSFVAAIEFTELVLPNGAIPFDTFLKSVDAPVRGLYWLIPGENGTMKSAHFRGPGSADRDHDPQRVARTPKPGVAVLIFRFEPAFDLCPGTPMTWTTVESETR